MTPAEALEIFESAVTADHLPVSYERLCEAGTVLRDLVQSVTAADAWLQGPGPRTIALDNCPDQAVTVQWQEMGVSSVTSGKDLKTALAAMARSLQED